MGADDNSYILPSSLKILGNAPPIPILIPHFLSTSFLIKVGIIILFLVAIGVAWYFLR
ncbi:MAG: hypothetical protein AABY00_01405 [Nanoarchaeota archaeon]